MVLSDYMQDVILICTIIKSRMWKLKICRQVDTKRRDGTIPIITDIQSNGDGTITSVERNGEC